MLGQKRVEANRIKAALEAEIKRYKDAIARQKSIEKQIAVSTTTSHQLCGVLRESCMCVCLAYLLQHINPTFLIYTSGRSFLFFGFTGRFFGNLNYNVIEVYVDGIAFC